jgi:hypothetical protein
VGYHFVYVLSHSHLPTAFVSHYKSLKKFSASAAGALHYHQNLSPPWGILVNYVKSIQTDIDWMCAFSACWSEQKVGSVGGSRALFHDRDNVAFTQTLMDNWEHSVVNKKTWFMAKFERPKRWFEFWFAHLSHCYMKGGTWGKALLCTLTVEPTDLLFVLITGRGRITGWRLARFLVHFTLRSVRTAATFGAVTCVLQHEYTYR